MHARRHLTRPAPPRRPTPDQPRRYKARLVRRSSPAHSFLGRSSASSPPPPSLFGSLRRAIDLNAAPPFPSTAAPPQAQNGCNLILHCSTPHLARALAPSQPESKIFSETSPPTAIDLIVKFVEFSKRHCVHLVIRAP